MAGTRDRLAAAATALLDEGGPAAVTLREVGARAGVSHNTPYRHFADKRDLLAAVAAAALHDLAEQVTAAPDLRTAALGYLDWAQARPNRFRLVFGAWGDEPHDELGAAADAAVSALTAQVRRAGLRADPARSAPLLWALCHGAAELTLTGHLPKQPGAPRPEELVDELLERLG
ncbi:TetR/AcrR family transcriptional regulator [Pseudonocardia pini]|uniref:TetR/AcrR family transcriptional regulator n=1 Tax=Pseudonocardia pini TaxID=2758030 RepID=UPI0028A8CEBE|nr:TetR/AcrR family transcriptional regulator [Pseudonocardia pini]